VEGTVVAMEFIKGLGSHLVEGVIGVVAGIHMYGALDTVVVVDSTVVRVKMMVQVMVVIMQAAGDQVKNIGYMFDRRK